MVCGSTLSSAERDGTGVWAMPRLYTRRAGRLVLRLRLMSGYPVQVMIGPAT